MGYLSHRVSMGAAIGAALLGSTGCVSTRTYERDAAAPTSQVDQVLLPARPHLEATVSRSDGPLHVALNYAMSCRRVETTTTRRERVERTRLGAGTYVSTGIFGLSGMAALGSGEGGAAFVLLGVGGAILGLAAAATGETAAPIAPIRSQRPDGVEPCARTPVANTDVVVMSAGRSHEGTTDSNGRLELDGVAAGPLRVVVGGQQVVIIEQDAPFIRKPDSSAGFGSKGPVGQGAAPTDAGETSGDDTDANAAEPSGPAPSDLQATPEEEPEAPPSEPPAKAKAPPPAAPPSAAPPPVAPPPAGPQPAVPPATKPPPAKPPAKKPPPGRGPVPVPPPPPPPPGAKAK